MTSHRRRILVAAEPRVLSDALGGVLGELDVDDVIVAVPGQPLPAGHYDAAVVSGDVPAGVTADLVIHLPDVYGSGGPGWLVDHGYSEAVHLDGVGDVIDLLDERCGATDRRRDRLGR